MTSEAAGRLAALAGVLGRAGEEPPTGRELAELLWLARQTGGEGRAGAPADPGPRPAVVTDEDPAGLHGVRTSRRLVAPPAEPPPEPARPLLPPPGPAPRVPLRTPAPPAPRAVAEETAGYTPLLAPAPPMLARPLALQRSLRPLRRTVPSGAERELDEAATADRIASLAVPGSGRRLWFPVLRPRQERWLHLRVVVDSGPTMTMWRPLARELHTAFAQTGAFRTLDLLRLGEDGLLPRRHRERGRTAVLVLSDAMGPQWRDGPAGLRWRAVLAALAREGPVALLQPLPERMWRHTAAPAVPGLFVSPAAGVPNTALGFTPYDAPAGAPGAVPLPVLEPSDVWLGNWAALVASPSGAEVPGAAAFVRPDALTTGPDDEGLVPEEADPEDLVLRFRALASPQAFRLAAHLAVGSAHLPVMRLVQAAVEERPEPRHLAEVVLSGMLRAEPDAAPGAYDFRPGVRKVLLAALPRTSLVRTAGLLARVSTEIEARAGLLPGEFRALAETLTAQRGERAAGRPFALVSEESVRLLGGTAPLPPAAQPGGRTGGGTYARPAGRTAPDNASDVPPPRLGGDRYTVGERLGGTDAQVWRGYDQYLQRDVALSYFPFPTAEQRSRTGRTGRDTRSAGTEFLARTYEVARVTAPNLLRVYDAVVLDEGCCLVTELVWGRSLRQRLDEAGGPLPVSEAVGIAKSVLWGLQALHRGGGFAHGNLTPSKVLGVDHRPRLSDFGLRWPYAPLHDDPDRTTRLPRSPGYDDIVRPVTVRYLAPERTRGRPTPEGDLYALGCILYEMLTGEPAAGGHDRETVLRHHAEGVARNLPALNPALPEQLRRALLGLLSHSGPERERGATLLRGLHLPGERPGRTPDYRLLGPPRARVRGRDVSEDAFQRNAFLARLLTARRRLVPHEEMAEVVRDSPRLKPAQYVLHLRALGIEVQVLDGGYLLDVPDSALDVARAESRIEAADGALSQGDRSAGRGLLRDALDLWRGEPLEGVPGVWAAGERRRLVELRASVEEQLALLDGPQAPPPGWLAVRALRPWSRTDEVVLELAGSAVGDTLRPSRYNEPPTAPVPPHREVPDLVEWAVTSFPYELARRLDRDTGPTVRVRLALHEGSEVAARNLVGTQVPDVDDPAGSDAAVVVTVLVSHELRSRLPKARRRDFGSMTVTASGWSHTVVVPWPPPEGGGRPPRAPEPESGPPPRRAGSATPDGQVQGP
ncbi:SAV_2336 N-terminal domain-related protein [Streptomyces sp. NPDC101115]|uniref:SAV_2336 N-terminal domain-related protein n=1 Tax=Streptomyces sp. NPDC101115 TaxID=3366106 RepID=UPI00380C62A0